MAQTQASLGIDWGTHSSKWTWTVFESDSHGVTLGQFKILHSDVRLDSSNHKIFLSSDPPPSDSVYESSIKGKVIRDPDGSFWGGQRRQTKLTLGDLVSFSLWFLLGEAYENLCANTGKEPDSVEFRFSLPNWVGIKDAAVARASYEQAARVACHIFVNDRQAWSRDPNPVREDWHANVQKALEELKISDEFEINAETQDFASLLQRIFTVAQGVTFRFVAESSAAGLTGLRNVEADLEGHRYLRKILVVDVGAGSTDIGYVLRTIPPGHEGANEALIQLPPANTCHFAGEELTRSIVEIYRSRGERITDLEAELRKTVREDKDWLNHPAVDEWRRSIAEHVLSYVADIPDRRWLPENPALQVLVTGGSSAVTGLGEKIVEAAKTGLERRGISDEVIQGTSLMTLSLEGPPAADANRLAVALGAASNDLPNLRYYPELDPPMPFATVRPLPPW
ncbi:MAG: hypothetical protein H7Z16_01675 [Pyrinomonadaceae bacterium]|nr:hypothetical protein [Pyrinomonadaceae bacterium]